MCVCVCERERKRERKREREREREREERERERERESKRERARERERERERESLCVLSVSACTVKGHTRERVSCLVVRVQKRAGSSLRASPAGGPLAGGAVGCTCHVLWPSWILSPNSRVLVFWMGAHEGDDPVCVCVKGLWCVRYVCVRES